MDRGTPIKYWPLALETAAYVLNRTPYTALSGKTPFDMGTGMKQNLKHTKIFGCKAYVQIPKERRRGKWSNTAWQGIMVGYAATNSPEWLILDLRTSIIRKAYSVNFNEEESGFETRRKLLQIQKLSIPVNWVGDLPTSTRIYPLMRNRGKQYGK